MHKLHQVEFLELIQRFQELKPSSFYRSFMEGTNATHALNNLTRQSLQKHQIRIVPISDLYQLRPAFRIKLLHVSMHGTMADYQASFNQYRIYVKLLNLAITKVPSEDRIGQGAFGSIEMKSLVSNDFVSKVQFGRISPEKIEDVVREVAISKLCSALRIGPAVETEIPFDLIVYENAIQFHLERCLPVQMVTNHMGSFEKDLKDDLASLHFLHIIHKDIKPTNILWSPKFNKFVFCDYGISHFVPQKAGEKSETNCEGTPRYMSPEIKRVVTNTTGMVDLYYNDAYGLSMTLKEMRNTISNYGKKSISLIEQIQHELPRSEEEVNRRGDNELKRSDKQPISRKPLEQIKKEGQVNEDSYSKQEKRERVVEEDTKDQTEKLKIILLKEADSSYETTQTSQQQCIEVISPSNIIFVDSYEFYRSLFASVAMNNHNFDIMNNLKYISREQFEYIKSSLMRCNSKDKIDSLEHQIGKAQQEIVQILDTKDPTISKLFLKLCAASAKFADKEEIAVLNTFLENCGDQPYSTVFMMNLMELARSCSEVRDTNIAEPNTPQSRPSEDIASVRNYIRLLGMDQVLKEELQNIKEGRAINAKSIQTLLFNNLFRRSTLTPDVYRRTMQLFQYERFRQMAEAINNNRRIAEELKEWALLDLASLQKHQQGSEEYLSLLQLACKKKAKPEDILEYLNNSSNFARHVIIVLMNLGDHYQSSQEHFECFKRVIKLAIELKAQYRFELTRMTMIVVLMEYDHEMGYEKLLPDPNYPDECPLFTTVVLFSLNIRLSQLAQTESNQKTALRLKQILDIYDGHGLTANQAFYEFLRNKKQTFAELTCNPENREKLFEKVLRLIYQCNRKPMHEYFKHS